MTKILVHFVKRVQHDSFMILLPSKLLIKIQVSFRMEVGKAKSKAFACRIKIKVRIHCKNTHGLIVKHRWFDNFGQNKFKNATLMF